MSIVVHFDGLCEPNPGGVATFGFVVEQDGRRIHSDAGMACPPNSPEATNNVAEYTGLLRALEWLVKSGHEKEPTVMHGDSELVIKQMKGEWKIKSPSLARFHKKASELAFQFPSIKFEHVRREQNREADALTNRAYAEYHGEGRKTVRAELMKVELVVRASKEAVEAALRTHTILGKAEAVPGGVKMTCQILSDPASFQKLLDIKAELEA